MNKQGPRVDVIIPTHNRWPMVKDAVDSVLTQSYHNLGCIVVDDASTDGSVKNLQEIFGDKIQILSNTENREKSYNRNRGVLESKADYVCFLDSDDVLLPNAVTDRLAVFEKDPSFHGVVYGFTRAEDESTEVGDHQGVSTLDVGTYLKDKGDLRTNSYLIERQVMLDKGMYNESLTNREDIELFVRLMCQMEFRCCGTLVSQYRKSAPTRARDDWKKIISQGTGLTDAIARDNKLLKLLGEHYIKMRASEYQELLRALYRAKSYKQFIGVYQQAVEEGVSLTSRFKRRYLFSHIMKYCI
ncbi:glycosyltransferase family 2 protein [Aurantivibrio plasticivorans]